MLIDSHGRHIDYLRLSVTGNCNLRCLYCLPEGYRGVGEVMDIMDDEEMLALLSIFTSLGIRRVRVTGGEPLTRPGILELVRGISTVAGLSDLSMTTNGTLLAHVARGLKCAGLDRVNVSLDTLDPERFRRITRHGRLQDVLAGVHAALEAGLSPVKVNVVVGRGINEDEIDRFVEMTEKDPVHVRFIELMPVGDTDFFSVDRWVPLGEMMERAAPLEPLNWKQRPAGGGPARYYRRPGSAGTVGFISALSRRFCSSCNRVRLTAGGMLVTCLDSSGGTDLVTPLRNGAGPGVIGRLIVNTVSKKPAGHTMHGRINGRVAHTRFMCQIGG